MRLARQPSLGHDSRVHNKFYCLNESVVEPAKVSKLLISTDKGRMHKYARKYVDDIVMMSLYLTIFVSPCKCISFFFASLCMTAVLVVCIAVFVDTLLWTVSGQ